jgi:protein TonB
MKTLSDVESPWQRLPWTLPTALLILAVAVWGLASFMERPGHRQQGAPPIDAQFVELPAPAASQTIQPERPVAVPKPKPLIRMRHEQALEPVKAAEQPAAPAREISLPDASPASDAGMGPSLPAANPSAPGGTGSHFGPRAVSRAPSAAGSPSGVQTTLPGFGAAYLNNPKPAYPALARKMGIEGRVTLKVFVSKEGKPLHIEVAESSGHDLLDKAAFDAVKDWRFVPARKGDISYDEWVQVPIVFKLNK